jgi:hypothetical protein
MIEIDEHIGLDKRADPFNGTGFYIPTHYSFELIHLSCKVGSSKAIKRFLDDYACDSCGEVFTVDLEKVNKLKTLLIMAS